MELKMIAAVGKNNELTLKKSSVVGNDLVLSINETYDHNALKLEDWEDFLDILCGDREYQKNAIKNRS